ncbi:MAG: hypothetical protein LBU32_03850 [Clostridiales bacterium]|nr:hypothetical protein [Clostridiales bacterium]
MKSGIQCAGGGSGGPNCSSAIGSMAYGAASGGSRKMIWEPDAALAPMTPGGAGAGKGGAQMSPGQGARPPCPGAAEWRRSWAGQAGCRLKTPKWRPRRRAAP